MPDDDIDLDRVISDPAYRRRVIEYLNIGAEADGHGTDRLPASSRGASRPEGPARPLG